MIGVMVGAGIFVAIGQAGKDTGPATFLAYLLLGPITLLVALPYIVFHSTPLGNLAGGAYIHISRTFKRYLPGFLTMWLTWITYVGVLSVLSISVGNYLQAFFPELNPKIAASACLLIFYAVNAFGAKKYGRLQSLMFMVLILSIALIIVPGLFAVKTGNFTPFMPKGFSGFFKSLTVLFFAYAGFDALAQTAGETKSATKTLPKVFLRGIVISMLIYVAISFITFGVMPYAEVIGSKMPVAAAADYFLPFGSQIVAIGAIAAFLTTINASMMAPSRILYVFAEDRVAPAALARLTKKSGAPLISLTINAGISLFLIWNHAVGFLIAMSLQAIIILYFTECLALALLPKVNKELWNQVPNNLRKKWVPIGGGVACCCLLGLYLIIPNPISLPLIIWTALGLGFYAYERYRGKVEGFNYAANLSIADNATLPTFAKNVTPTESVFYKLNATLKQITDDEITEKWYYSGDKIYITGHDDSEKVEDFDTVPATGDKNEQDERHADL